MMRKIALLAALLALPATLTAQEGGAGQPAAAEARPEQPVLGGDELAEKQAAVAEQVRKIEQTMDRIADQLAGRNPDEAARLRMAWQRSKDDRNVDRILEILDLLRAESWDYAYKEQQELETSLQRLLDILLDRDAERKDLAEQIERYQSMVENLNQLIQRERDHQLQTEQFADPEKALQRAAAAKARLADLIDREKAIESKTGQDPAQAGDGGIAALAEKLRALQEEQRALKGGADAAKQEQLAERADELAREIGKAGEKLDAQAADAPGRRNPAAQAADALGRAAQQMRDAAGKMAAPGGQPATPSQEGAEQDLREASEALQRLGSRLDQQREKDLAAEQERVKRDTERLREEMERLEKGAPGNDSGSGNLREAEGDMEAARKKIDKGAREQAQPHAEAAREKLERAYKQFEEFEEQLKKLTELPDYEKLAKKQDDTAENRRDLKKLDRMPKPQPDGRTTGKPGREGGRRREARDGARLRNLRSQSAKGANSDQKEAVERLEKAQRAARGGAAPDARGGAADAPRRDRAAPRAHAARADRPHKRTISLHLRLKASETPGPQRRGPRRTARGRRGRPRRGGRQAARDAAGGGLDVVIPDVVSDLRADLDGLAVRLRRFDAGPYTQQIQQDVIDDAQGADRGRAGGAEPAPAQPAGRPGPARPERGRPGDQPAAHVGGAEDAEAPAGAREPPHRALRPDGGQGRRGARPARRQAVGGRRPDAHDGRQAQPGGGVAMRRPLPRDPRAALLAAVSARAQDARKPRRSRAFKQRKIAVFFRDARAHRARRRHQDDA